MPIPASPHLRRRLLTGSILAVGLLVSAMMHAAAFGQTPIARYESMHRDRDLALRLEVVHQPEAPDWFPPTEGLGPGPYLSFHYEVQTCASDGETTRTLWQTQIPYSIFPVYPDEDDLYYNVAQIHDVSVLGGQLVVLFLDRSMLFATTVAPGGRLKPLNPMDEMCIWPVEQISVQFLVSMFRETLHEAHIEVLEAKTFTMGPPCQQNTDVITLGPRVFIAAEKRLYGNRPNDDTQELVRFFMIDHANPFHMGVDNWRHATHASYPRALGIAPQEAPTSLRHKIGQGRAFPDMPPYEEILEDALAKVKAMEAAEGAVKP
ncbi:MAG: hypothetical protein KF858_03735 [Candidatus Sumerlaeia bacterium]|nr:hypothetical protein [Candidatus Sumerlaeia bacterium]